MSQLDEKLARISSRIAARSEQQKTDREEIRQRIAFDPVLSLLADYAWNRTGAGGGLTWLKLPDFERGRELPPGVTPAPPYEVKHRAKPITASQSRAGQSAQGEGPGEGPRQLAAVLREKRPRNLPAAKGQRGG